MPPRAWDLRVHDILGCIARIEKYIDDLDESTFQSDQLLIDAVVRNLEVIGEAAARVPPEIQASASGVDWAAMRAMRNLIVHEYHRVDPQVVWDTVHGDLKPLRDQ